MKSFLTILSLLTFTLASPTTTYGTCRDTWIHGSETTSGNCGINQSPATLTKIVPVTIYWLDGYQRTVNITGTGQAGDTYVFTNDCPRCWPSFHTPTWEENGNTAYWSQKTYPATINVSTNACTISTTPSSDNRQGHTCSTVAGRCGGLADYINFPSSGCITGLFFQGPCNRSVAFQSRCADPTGYEHETCTCPDGTSMSPIVIDVDHSGFSMTSAAGGVVFDMLNDGVPLAISWTAAGSTNALLVLDRNSNGTIDNGEELFGDITPQPATAAPNGFVALAEYDKSGNGGNGNGRIERHDSIFSQLRLWQDFNHNGISEATELQPLSGLIRAIDLDYKRSRRIDEHGNQFRYRAKVYDVHGAHAGRWAWDVFVTVQ